MSTLGPRASGVLLPISSLPGGHGIGDLGHAAADFLAFLERAGQHVWQILPVHVTSAGAGNSPYSALSAFALDPLLLAQAPLIERGWLPADSETPRTGGEPSAPPDAPIDFARVRREKSRWIDVASRRRDAVSSTERDALARFRTDHASWIEDYALFVALREAHGSPWISWPEPLRDRDPEALAGARAGLNEALERAVLAQYLVFTQWAALRANAERHGVRLFGDLPMYVAHESADVWAHRAQFRLGPGGQALVVSGVPPDFFSETGQFWNQPIPDWAAAADDGYAWFANRIAHELALVDLVRIDHFRAVSAYWEIPADAETAAEGSWQPGPGAALLDAIRRRLPEMALVAEDLGDIDEPVRALMDTYALPGMRILQFGFHDGFPTSIHLPHRYPEDCVAYTGTHDNNTARGWFEDDASPEERRRVRSYTQIRDASEVPDAFVRDVLGSVARLAVLPLQDVAGLGSGARLNRPGEPDGHWAWRASPAHMTNDVADHLAELTRTYGRGR